MHHLIHNKMLQFSEDCFRVVIVIERRQISRTAFHDKFVEHRNVVSHAPAESLIRVHDFLRNSVVVLVAVRRSHVSHEESKLRNHVIDRLVEVVLVPRIDHHVLCKVRNGISAMVVVLGKDSHWVEAAHNSSNSAHEPFS